MNNPLSLRILHLSDIQYGRHHVDIDKRPRLYPDDNYSPQLQKILDDLDVLKENHGISPNYIVVTGDIAEWSLRSEYEDAEVFLGGIAGHLKIDRRYVILVPGNHDINRDLCQAARLMASAKQKSFDPPYFPKFEFYQAFFDKFYKNVSFPRGIEPYQFTVDRLFVNYYFPEAGAAFLALNSCIDESEEDPHYGNITVAQLKKAIDELNAFDADKRLLRIALMHHNFVRSSEVMDNENLQDADDLKPELLKNGIRLILHGHQHFPRDEVTGKGDQKIHVLATGSAGLDGNTLPDTPRRYQVIAIDGPHVRIYRRFFDNTYPGPSGKGCWKPDISPDASVIFDTFTIDGLPATPSEEIHDKATDSCKVSKPLIIPEAYRQWVLETCGHMDVDKLRERGSAITVSLPEVFVSLYANPPGADKKDTIDDTETLLRDRVHAVNIETLIAEGDDLLISGEAGSGKTTLIKHFVFMAMSEPGWQGLDDVLPVLIFLKNFRGFDTDKANHDMETARALLQHSFNKSGCGLDIGTVENYCAAGKALFFFDGLDEIPVELRNLVVNAFATFRRGCQGGKFILSGRPHGLEGDVVDFIKKRRVSILPLAMDQVETFITRWFQNVEESKSRTVQKSAAQMISEIKYHPGVHRLIHNPLMLTAVCILYYDERELPGQRAELYKKFVDNMPHRRFKDPEPVHTFLMSLAHHMHTPPQRMKGIDKGPAMKVLKTAYPHGELSDEEYRRFIRKTFDRIEPNCGLLKFDSGQLMFRHLTFQEFLTAAYIKDRKTRYDEAIQEYWQDGWYKEVVELLVGLLSIDSRQWANDIVESALKNEDETPFLRWRLAARSILDIHEDRRYPEVLDLARQRMQAIMGSKTDTRSRAEAGRTLGWIKDPRELAGFVAVPAGSYTLSTGKCKIKPFELSQHPVTNLWYADFVENHGYETESLWSTEGWKWRNHTQTRQPMFWHDRKWNCSNHPVVGVCWYEADAFCRWLSQTRDDGYAYSLPTEQHWEAAAAGFDQRKYPWGSDFDSDRCNTREAEIEQTSAVGIFVSGQTPEEGIHDLAGNVWEWTCSSFHSKNALTDFRFEADAQELYKKIISTTGEEQDKIIDQYGAIVKDKNRQLPVLRGGSWDGDEDDVRCVFRDRSHPGDRSGNVGFRCSRTKR